jgi:hypothetical protein
MAPIFWHELRKSRPAEKPSPALDHKRFMATIAGKIRLLGMALGLALIGCDVPEAAENTTALAANDWHQLWPEAAAKE